MSEFFVGQKVACVDASEHKEWAHRGDGLDGLAAGRTYTIRAIDPPRANHSPCLRLSEIIRPMPDTGYNAGRFRPLESKAISLFRKIARDVTEGRKVEFVE